MPLLLLRTAKGDDASLRMRGGRPPRKAHGSREAGPLGTTLPPPQGPAARTEAAPGGTTRGVGRTTPTAVTVTITPRGIIRTVGLGPLLHGTPLTDGTILGQTGAASRSRNRTRGLSHATSRTGILATRIARPHGAQKHRDGPGRGRRHHQSTVGRTRGPRGNHGRARSPWARQPLPASLSNSFRRSPGAGLRHGFAGVSCAQFPGQVIRPTTRPWSRMRPLRSSEISLWMTCYRSGKSAPGRTLQHLVGTSKKNWTRHEAASG